ncbi:MAG: flagellar hook-basal body complex protein [Devosia sp.]|jgi:flagellar hook protein FlgE
MGIYGALSTAVTGLNAQSFALENISGNIANSQTIGFKRVDTSFLDLIPDQPAKIQTSGSVLAQSQSTNTLQGDVKSVTNSTYMAVNGSGFFVVQPALGESDGTPVFGNTSYYTRRGDFDINKDGYLVNGSGYYLEGLPIDSKTGNVSSSLPQVIRVSNSFLPAQPTTRINYQLNLPQLPQNGAYQTSKTTGSELLQPGDFLPAGPPTLANAVATGSAALATSTTPAASGSATAASVYAGNEFTGDGTTNDSIVIDSQTITFDGTTDGTTAIADSTTHKYTLAEAIQKINHDLLAGGSTVTAAAGTGTDAGKIVLTNSATGTTSNFSVDPGTTAGGGFGTSVVTTTNGAAASGGVVVSGGPKSFTITLDGGTPTTVTLSPTGGTNGDGHYSANDIKSAINSALTTAGVTTLAATVDTGGHVVLTSTSATKGTGDTIAVADVAASGLTAALGLAASTAGTSTPTPGTGTVNTVSADDSSAFINQSISGGAITVYGSNGAPANVQLRWAKIASTASGGSDQWQLFYETNSAATGGQAMWTNAGQTYTFGADGALNPAVTETDLSGVSVDGVSLGNIKLNFGAGGITQFADPNGTAGVTTLTQDGYAAGKYTSVSIDDSGRVVVSYDNGQTVETAQVVTANFNAANNLKRLDGGIFAATADSGEPVLNSDGGVIGSSLESSNTDISTEFTKLIVTQQAYAAGTKIVTTADDMLQQALNMIR